jgi:pimeloyl-ACP methyl ester carboxylesterase
MNKAVNQPEAMSLAALMEAHPERVLQLDGTTLGYREFGQGPVLLLLHGISSSSLSWLWPLQLLGQHYRVIAWDAPGYGASTALTTDQATAVHYAQRLRQLCLALQLHCPLIIGHSLGALVAAAYVAQYAAQCRGLILVDPAQGYAAADAAQQAVVYQKRPQLWQDLGAVAMAAQLSRKLLAQPSADRVWLLQQVMQQLSLLGLRQASYLLAYDSIERYLLPQNEFSVIYGELDQITLPAAIVSLAHRHQARHCIALGVAGHLSYLDQPEQFVAAVLRIDHQDKC